MNFYPPPKQRGLIIHVVLSAALLLLAGYSAANLVGAPLSLSFTIFLLLLLGSLALLPVLVYRIYALVRAEYSMDRNTLHLVWGLRVEDIPISDVEWMRPAVDLTIPLRLPWFRLPGGLLGFTRHPDVGLVEFMASAENSLLLVATARQVFAISPEDAAAFVRFFQHAVEMGSLSQGEGRSQYPSFVISRAWESPLVRYLWLVGLFVNIGLLVWASVLLPGIERLPMGFDARGLPLEAVPAGQLILLPVLSALLFAAGWLAGLFFYRREDLRLLSLSMWASGLTSSLAFLFAVFFLTTAAG